MMILLIPLIHVMACFMNMLPRKKKDVRGNKAPFIKKELSKGIILRSRITNIFLKEKAE